MTPYATRRVAFTLLAFFVAPALPAAGLAWLQGASLQNLPLMFPACYLFTAVATFLIGLPVYLVLKRLDLVRWWSASACGGFAGFVGVMTIIWLTGASDPPSAFPELPPLGAVGGLLFWVIWRLGRS